MEEDLEMDLTTLRIIGLIIIVVVMLLNRSRGGYSGPFYGRGNRGAERPTYDDPNYRSSGSIGGAEPPLRERGVGEGAPAAGPSRPSNDDPNYRSGGSIG
jgi:hypothetical protein